MSNTPKTNPQATIRAMSGAAPIEALTANTTALLVIDFQNEYFTGHMPIPAGEQAMRNTQKLIAWADQHQIPVFQVQHIAPAGSAVFAMDGETVQFHPQMQPRAGDVVVQKENVSVFVGTNIDEQLRSRNVGHLIITGLMTHACVAGAARDAAVHGYQVVVASDASATRSITRANGESVEHAALHNAALAEIEDTFGDVLTTAQITQLALR